MKRLILVTLFIILPIALVAVIASVLWIHPWKIDRVSVTSNRGASLNLINLDDVRNQLARFESTTTIGQDGVCAFGSVAEKNAYTLGQPLPVFWYVATPKRIMPENVEQTLITGNATTYYIPIMSGDTARCMVEGSLTNGKFTVNGVGYRGMSDPLEIINHTLASGSKAGTIVAYVNILSADTTFVDGLTGDGRTVWLQITGRETVREISTEELSQFLLDNSGRGGLIGQ